MSFRSQLVLVFALIAGIGFSVGFKATFYNKTAEPTEQEIKAAQEKQIPVMVAKGNLAVGEELTAQNVRFQCYPESQIPWNAIFHFQDADGRSLVKPVRDGRLISLFDLNDPDEENKMDVSFIPPGYQPVAVEIAAVRGENPGFNQVKQMLHPQDKVTLSVIEEIKSQTAVLEDGKSAQRKLTTTPLFDNVEVFQVSTARKPVEEGNEIKKVMIVSLLLNDEQEQQIKDVMKSGNLLMTIHSDENNSLSVQGDITAVQPMSESEPAEINSRSETDIPSVSVNSAVETSNTADQPIPENSTQDLSSPDTGDANFPNDEEKTTDGDNFTPRAPSSDFIPIRAARKSNPVEE